MSAVRTVRGRRAGRRRAVAGAVVVALAGLGLSGCMSVGAAAPDARSGGLQGGGDQAVDPTAVPGAGHVASGARGRHGAVPAADAERRGATPAAPSSGAEASPSPQGVPTAAPTGTPSTRSVDTPTGPPADGGGATAAPTPTPTPTSPTASADPDPVPTILGSSAPSGGSTPH